MYGIKEEETNVIYENKMAPLSFSKDVTTAIDMVLKSADPMGASEFNSVDYINQLFPNEQSLVNIDETIHKMQCDLTLIDDNIRSVVRMQSNTGRDGQLALNEAQKVINNLYDHIIDVKTRAEHTEEMVKEITRDIKQLDCAKRNLTSAITTLNHLHMLVGGIENLKSLIEKRLYGEILNPLQAILEVNQHFQQYSEIAEIKDLSKNVAEVQSTLSIQISEDFKNAFRNTKTNIAADHQRLSPMQLADACKVISVLDAKVKKDLLKWFIAQQLEEYLHLFHENQDIAWLDKIDKRFAWIKRHLLDFENKFASIFPIDWEISERMAVEFCRITCDQLSNLMSKRTHEIDVRLLMFAINKTQTFEQLLSKRFTGITLCSNENLEQINNDDSAIQFRDRITSCFKPYLGIYIKSIDTNLTELIEKFVESAKKPHNIAESKTTVFSSSADLFVFYKKCMIQCNQFGNDQTMYDLALLFKKYLREYAGKVLEITVPKLISSSNSIGKSMSILTRDMQNLSSAAGQVIHNFLKEGETQRFSKDELIRICCVLTTAEYCLETVEQLESKLKEKVSAQYTEKIDMAEEKDVYHRLISNCIQLLVQDLEGGCEAGLQAMMKVQWQTISNVGDQSPFISSMCSNFKQTIPIIRETLANSRKYFTQFCHKFVNAFIPKFINVLYKCKLTFPDGSNNVLGCEQLLLDTHSLKTALLELPSTGSNVNRKAPTSFTKVVIKEMTRAEMIIKVVMTNVQPAPQFIQQVMKLLPDITVAEFQKLLDMKTIKRVDQLQLIDLYKRSVSTTSTTGVTEEFNASYLTNKHSDLPTNEQQLEKSVDEKSTPKQSHLDKPDSSSSPRRPFMFSVGNFSVTNNAENSSTVSSATSNDRGRIRKLENLLKKHLP